MTVTRRFIFIIAAGALPVFAGYFINMAVPLFILYNLVCLILFVVDYGITPSSSIFEVQRTGEDKLSIYEKEKIDIMLINKSDYNLNVYVKDSIPDFYFEPRDIIISKRIMAHSREVFQYEVMPQKRGAFTFKDVYIRYYGRMGLCIKAFRVPLHKEYKVYPNLKNLRKYHICAINNKKYYSGLKRMKTLGTGTSFESLREYIPGDEYRKINWQATARENKPIVNQYEPEKDQHVYALIDCGRSMSYSVRGHNKLDMAVNTALVLSDIVNQNGDKCGILTFNTGLLNFIAPGKGPGHRNNIMEALYHIEHTNYTSDYEEAFLHIKKHERHRSIVFLFTDFDTIEEAEEMSKILHIISRNNVVIIMLIKNESLLNITNARAKSEEDVFTKAVAMELLLERKNIINILNKMGIMCIECEIEEIETNTINKYLQVKNRMYF